MKAEYIHIGDTLEVKAHVRESCVMPDGSQIPVLIKVERISFRPGYKRPFFHAAGGAFRSEELEPVR